MKLRSRIAGLARAPVAALALLAPASAQSANQALASGSVIERIKADGVITIGQSHFTRWSLRDLDGELVGFELAADMGIEVEFGPTAWDGILPALISRNFDVFISGMPLTAQRNLTVALSDPYAYAGQMLPTNTAMTEGFTQEVLNGNAHALMTSEPVPSKAVRILLGESFMSMGPAFAFRNGEPDAESFFNYWIAANTRSGWLQDRHDYWLTGDGWHDMVAA